MATLLVVTIAILFASIEVLLILTLRVRLLPCRASMPLTNGAACLRKRHIVAHRVGRYCGICAPCT